ncbi:hypothetical protein SAMN06893097_103101 [Geodermatophilus sabuli]|uniref:Tetracyclin repressor-like C-terminal domain-containing protein n=1 Tax=Geodermatophilus sabuli TaxID=1564158 RepID=A0A285EA28_9ACTN|nr:hypothetical protein SAMN06893097_103101 [Geodermatophilus sabuli]
MRFAANGCRAQAAGRLRREADPQQVGATMFSLVLGFLLQRLLLGDVPAAAYGDAVRALVAGGTRPDGQAGATAAS